jgi:menaquinone-dependent protoporphyrinogen oxidase
MTVLVVAASRHGATWELAEVIAAELFETGPAVDLVNLTEGADPDPGGYAAVVLGSAVYGAHWLVPAVRWADDHRDVLRRMPVWLFSSGPVTPGPLPAEADAVLVRGMVGDLGARDHRLFGGKLTRAGLTPQELAVVTAFDVADVDARDLADVRAWAREVGRELGATAAARGTGRG